jgi:hypothetical protein
LTSKDQWRTGPERIDGITSLPLPGTKQELRKFLGLVGYCSLWINSYTLKTKSLYLKLTQEGPDPLLWTPEDIKQVDELQQALSQPHASLALSWTAFSLLCKCKQGSCPWGANPNTWGSTSICGLPI